MNDSLAYWNDRYIKGKTSGRGSFGILADYKISFINKLISDKDIRSVADFGCGDGNQISKLLKIPYFGYDTSSVAIDMCNVKFTNDEQKSFHLLPVHDLPLVDLAISLDVIFHILTFEEFVSYLQILFRASNRYVLIYSSNFDSTRIKHIKHWNFTTHVNKLFPEWKLSLHEPNPHNIYQGSVKISFADFYLYSNSY